MGKDNQMEALKALFGTDALTWEQLEEKLNGNKDVKLANLVAGGYVDKGKYDDKVAELGKANDTIKGLKETVTKFDGVDIDALKKSAADWENKYNADLAAVKLDGAVNMGVVAAKAKNTKLVKSALDMSLIKLDGENLVGLTEQIDNLRKSDPYLFEEETKTESAGGAFVFNTGGNHKGGGDHDAFMGALMKGAGLEDKK